MFDIGMGEIGVVAIVGLLVLGPERLPRVARTVGALMRKARQSWHSVRDEIERELAAEDLKRQMREVQEAAAAADVRNDIADAARAVREAVAPSPVPTPAAAPAPAAEPHPAPASEPHERS